MGALLKDIEAKAMQLPQNEQDELIHHLIVSREREPEDSPEAIAKAWDEEIARRVADMDVGRTKWMPADEVMTKLRAKIAAVRDIGWSGGSERIRAVLP